MRVDINPFHRRLAIAPMMELTDRHYRYLARLLTRHTLLYTEMLTCNAVIHGDRDYLLGKDTQETPVVLQLGGCDPDLMAKAAIIGEEWGYSEINMNVGCPSDRVKAGRFGACLMAEPDLVREVVAAMQDAVDIPVSVKCRLGIDRDDSYEVVEQFVETVASSGCRYFIVHARKAWLDGLSPKENRSVPPIRYEFVYRLKRRFPELHFTINGEITSLNEAQDHLAQVDGVMMGRAAYYNPGCLLQADARIFPDIDNGHQHEPTIECLADIAMAYAEYMQPLVNQGVRLSGMSRHMVSLYQNVPGARLWRRHISEQAGSTSDVIGMVQDALKYVQQNFKRQSA